MPPSDNSSRFDKTYRWVLVLVTAAILMFALIQTAGYFRITLTLLGLVLMLTYILLWPVALVEHCIDATSKTLGKISLYRKLIHRGPDVRPRLLAVIIVYVLFFSVVTVTSINLSPVLTRQLHELIRALPRYVTQTEVILLEWSDDVFGSVVLKEVFQPVIEEAASQGILKDKSTETEAITEEEKAVIHQSVLKTTLLQIVELIEQATQATLENINTLITRTLEGLIYLLAALTLLFYFLLDGPDLRRNTIRLFPKNLQQDACYFTDHFHRIMQAFIKGQVLLGLLTGAYMTIIYSIFHVKFAVLLGAIFAMAELLPVVGTWIGLLPGLTVATFTIGPLGTLFVWLCSYCYQTIKDNIIAPKVVGEVMGLHPVTVILSLVICAKLAGLVGILLALPLASFLNIGLRYLFHELPARHPVPETSP